jgi:hypothetical protein
VPGVNASLVRVEEELARVSANVRWVARARLLARVVGGKAPGAFLDVGSISAPALLRDGSEGRARARAVGTNLAILETSHGVPECGAVVQARFDGVVQREYGPVRQVSGRAVLRVATGVVPAGRQVGLHNRWDRVSREVRSRGVDGKSGPTAAGLSGVTAASHCVSCQA